MQAELCGTVIESVWLICTSYFRHCQRKLQSQHGNMGLAYIVRPCPSKSKQKREDSAVYARTQCFVGWGYKSVEECGYQLKAVFLVGFMMWACNLSTWEAKAGG